MKKRIILASGSPRRKEILKQVNIDFDVISIDCEEIADTSKPDELVLKLSNDKAKNVLDKVCYREGGNIALIVIGADTVVSCNDKILGKPKDKDDAFNMISEIQDNVHQVYTGITIYSCIPVEDEDNSEYVRKILERISEYEEINIIESNKNFIEICGSFAVKTDVYVNRMSEHEILEYINSSEPYDKAGGYGIQGAFAKYIGKISGDYYNVVGLPVSKVYSIINLIS